MQTVAALQVSDTGDTAADLHILVCVVVDGKPVPLKTDLTVLPLEQDLIFRVFENTPVILYPRLITTCQRYLQRAQTNVLRELQRFHQ